MKPRTEETLSQTIVLLNCPFCAGYPRFDRDYDNDGHASIPYHFIKCTVCGAQTKHFSEYNGSEEECKYKSSKAWNRRI
jgi:hypothetical protein